MEETDNTQVNKYVFDIYLAFCFTGDNNKKWKHGKEIKNAEGWGATLYLLIIYNIWSDLLSTYYFFLTPQKTKKLGI